MKKFIVKDNGKMYKIVFIRDDWFPQDSYLNSIFNLSEVEYLSLLYQYNGDILYEHGWGGDNFALTVFETVDDAEKFIENVLEPKLLANILIESE